ncbi:MAG: hypothetical protein ACFFFH_12505 [Candidatus Thorarchaeota archaeon]
MTSPSNFKKFLIILLEKELIDENQYVKTLDGLKSSLEINENQFTPFLDMYGLKQLDSKLQHLNQSIIDIDTKIKGVIQAWETKKLAKNETKTLLTELVAEQNRLVRSQKKFQFRIQKKILRMKSLEETSNFDIERFVSSFQETTYSKELASFLSEFEIIWSKYSAGIIPKEKLEDRIQKLNEVELEILRTLMVPIPESEKEIFNLDEVIQPIDQDKSFKTSLLSRAQEEEPIDEIQDEVLEVKEITSPWDLVGLTAFDSNKTPLGLFRPPIVINKSIYLPIVKEKPLTISILKKGYRDVFNQVGLDLNVITTQQIRNQIINALKIPEELALQPSYFNQWISELGLEVVPAKPQLTKAWFVEPDLVKKGSLELLSVKKEELKKLSIPAWIPARGEKIAQQAHIGQRVIGMAGSEFGLIAGIMNETPYGQCLIIERKVPPSYLLDLYLKGLGKENLAELRIFIAKELHKEEREAFSAENLWLICNQERLLISPHEIIASYYSVLPAAAFNFSAKIHAKIGVYYHSIPETFRYLVGKPLYKAEEETGLIYGFSVLQGEFSILWSSQDPIDVIKRLGKKTSDQYINRLRRRISLALDTSYEKSIWPSNLARYFMNFIWMEEQLILQKALTVIKERFYLQELLFSEITNISKDGLKCRE